jgi:hypothetical protein
MRHLTRFLPALSLGINNGCGQPNRKRRSLPQGTLGRDGASHHLTEALTDCQSQPGAAVLTGS